MQPATALIQLRSFPLQFLHHHIIKVLATPDLTSGPCDNFFGHPADMVPFTAPNPPLDEFWFCPHEYIVDLADPVPVPVQLLRMTPPDQHQDYGDLESYTVQTQPDLLITPRISQCSLPILEEGGRLLMAHLQPDPQGYNAFLLRGHVENWGQFSGEFHEFTQVFGPPNYDPIMQRVNVVGVYKNARWQVFAQYIVNFLVSSEQRIAGVVQLVG